MSVEANKATVRRFVEEVLDGGRNDVLQEIFPRGVRHFPGRDVQVGGGGGGPRNYTAFHTDIHHLFGEGDLVTVHLTHHVTFGPNSKWASRAGPVEASGKSVQWSAIVVFRFEGDTIVEEWVNRDELYVLMQLGAVSAAAGV